MLIKVNYGTEKDKISLRTMHINDIRTKKYLIRRKFPEEHKTKEEIKQVVQDIFHKCEQEKQLNSDMEKLHLLITTTSHYLIEEIKQMQHTSPHLNIELVVNGLC